MALWFSVIFQILAIKLHYLKKKVISQAYLVFFFSFYPTAKQNYTKNIISCSVIYISIR